MTIGKTDLSDLLRTMEPVVTPEIWVFVTVDPATDLTHVDPLMTFREREGLTAILTEENARQAGLPYTYRSRMITLNVHSSLEAVGFMACVSEALAAGGISVNPVAGYFHDHLFVPADRLDEAMNLLSGLVQDAT